MTTTKQDPEANVWDVDYPDHQLESLIALHQRDLQANIKARDVLNERILQSRQRLVAYHAELARREEVKGLTS
jgi:hypothetical protein